MGRCGGAQISPAYREGGAALPRHDHPLVVNADNALVHVPCSVGVGHDVRVGPALHVKGGSAIGRGGSGVTPRVCDRKRVPTPQSLGAVGLVGHGEIPELGGPVRKRGQYPVSVGVGLVDIGRRAELIGGRWPGKPSRSEHVRAEHNAVSVQLWDYGSGVPCWSNWSRPLVPVLVGVVPEVNLIAHEAPDLGADHRKARPDGEPISWVGAASDSCRDAAPSQLQRVRVG